MERNSDILEIFIHKQIKVDQGRYNYLRNINGNLKKQTQTYIFCIPRMGKCDTWQRLFNQQ